MQISYDVDKVNSDNFLDLWDKYIIFEKFYRPKGERLGDFLSQWRVKMASAQSAGCHYSDILLACKLLEKSNLENDDIHCIVSSIENLESDVLSILLARLETFSPEESERKESNCSSTEVKEEPTEKCQSLIEPRFVSPKHFIEMKMSGLKTPPRTTKCPSCGSSQGLVLVDDPDTKSQFLLFCTSCLTLNCMSTISYDQSDVHQEGDPHDIENKIKEENSDSAQSLLEIDISSMIGDHEIKKEKKMLQLGTNSSSSRRGGHPCPECGKTYNRVQAVIKHMTLKHKMNGPELKEFKERFMKRTKRKRKRNEELEDGIDIDTEGINDENEEDSQAKIEGSEPKRRKAERLQCEYCGKEYPIIARLKEHYVRCPNLDQEKRESYVRPYNRRLPCNICGKLFAGVNSLKFHITTHGEKNFICDICSAAFPNAHYLSIHKKRHKGLKPHKCDICAKTFAEKTVLKRHVMQIHTKERPFQCDQCSYSTANKNHLLRHGRQHVGDRPFKCGLCDKPFRAKKSVKNHLKTQHNLDDPTGNIIQSTPIPKMASACDSE